MEKKRKNKKHSKESHYTTVHMEQSFHCVKVRGCVSEAEVAAGTNHGIGDFIQLVCVFVFIWLVFCFCFVFEVFWIWFLCRLIQSSVIWRYIHHLLKHMTTTTQVSLHRVMWLVVRTLKKKLHKTNVRGDLSSFCEYIIYRHIGFYHHQIRKSVWNILRTK